MIWSMPSGNPPSIADNFPLEFELARTLLPAQILGYLLDFVEVGSIETDVLGLVQFERSCVNALERVLPCFLDLLLQVVHDHSPLDIDRECMGIAEYETEYHDFWHSEMWGSLRLNVSMNKKRNHYFYVQCPMYIHIQSSMSNVPVYPILHQ